MFDLINVFEVFLPQLLRYPNPSDPLNGEAAAMLIRDPAGFDLKVCILFVRCGKIGEMGDMWESRRPGRQEE